MMLSCTSEVPPSIELPRERSQSRVERELLVVVAGTFPAERLRTGDRAPAARAALVQLGAVELEDRALRTGLVARLGRVAAALRPSARRRARPSRRCAISSRSTGSESAPSLAEAVPARERSRAELAAARASRARDAEDVGDHVALEAEQRLGDPPAAVDLAEHVRDRHAHVVEAGLAEGRLAADQLDRAHRHAGGRMSISRKVMPSCFLAVRIRAHQREDPVRLVAVGGPDLGAVHDEVVALAHGARLRATRGRSRVRLGVALTPADLAAHDAPAGARRFCASVP